ncbi:pyruvate, phosphate dikinase [Comamonas serinivorans]|uniref:Phosphoenolpyruvate synthase n=1 Tax=Comamonas serinivorans TaxID=1082851 RepID=A0A1Y0ENQ8_9BURK|nr:PEP/pyruvate-binding domain-containing protein [Comamonas serinivorans]ARU05080.1 pyruvate, phosphate dikinase [Comamonas serinivorans]
MPIQPAALLVAALSLACPSASAQLARKPSAYDGAPMPAATSSSSANGTVRPTHALRLSSRAEFDRLARVYGAGTPLAQPHVLFVIDQGGAPGAAPRVLFVDTPRFQLHERFLRETGLLRGGKAALNRNYRAADRRFILGTLSWQPQVQGFVYEFWEGDQLTPQLLRTTATQLGRHFFAPLRFKANATRHEQVAHDAGLAAVTQAQLIGQQGYLPLNTGQAVGRLRLVDRVDQARDLGPQDIVVLREVPLALPPVAGVITERPSTLLSHVNLLAKGWGIPNAYVHAASAQLRALDGQWVHLSVGDHAHTVRAATPAEREQASRRPAVTASHASRTRPSAVLDLRSTAIRPLATLRRADSRQCGAKAANLGEVRAARIAGTAVPDGFCIPFGAYERAMQAFGLPQRVARMAQQPGFATDAGVRRQALAGLRAQIEAMPVDAALVRDWQSRWATQLRGAGVFVRSSSSSEDLAHFSGAGLYTTVPHVRGEAALTDAVRKVWASVFNFEAWEARQAAGLAPGDVVMAVLVQTAVDAQASGVLVTRDPVGRTPHATFIAAKRGLGIRVVEGQRVAEQVLYVGRSGAVQLLSQSGEATRLQLAPGGGLREVPLTGERRVLSDARVKRLASVGQAIERRFGGQAQDIEWALTDDDQQVLLLQTRPFVAAPHR